MLPASLNLDRMSVALITSSDALASTLYSILSGAHFKKIHLLERSSESLTILEQFATRPELVLIDLNDLPERSVFLTRLKQAFDGPVLGLVQSADRIEPECTEHIRGQFPLCSDDLSPTGYLATALPMKMESMLIEHHTQQLVQEDQNRTQRLFINVLTVINKILETKDPYTRFHSQSVAKWSRQIGRDLNLHEDDLNRLTLGALLHDFGKVGVKDDLLNKPSYLTAEEFSSVKTHPVIGRELLRSIEDLQDVLPIIAHHHERWDGRGYPDGMAGEGIPLWARIVCIADAIDTMATPRKYKPAFPLEKVIAEIRSCSGLQFDPRLVDICVLILEGRIRE
ncbi:MAG TPA: HD-GYP domain-containing protein, partial [Planctomycetota bacterium]|nr:HD-GYP domain-containing protein [Planctomycetota bacterium]